MSEKNTSIMAGLLDIIRDFKGPDFIEPKGAIAGLNFFSDFGLDSLELINLLFQIEQKYGIQVSDEDMKESDLMIVDNMASFIAKRK